MTGFDDLPNELLLDILAHATKGRTLREVFHLRRVNPRLREVLVPYYIQSGRLLETPLRTKTDDGLLSPCYRRLSHISVEVAQDLLDWSWDNPKVVDPRFARCVESIEACMCSLIPGLDRRNVHLRFCELFARQSGLQRGLYGWSEGLNPSCKTIRDALLIFTRVHGTHLRFGRIYDGDIKGTFVTRPSESEIQEPCGNRFLDRMAWSAAIAFGFAHSNGASNPLMQERSSFELDDLHAVQSSSFVLAAIMSNILVVHGILAQSWCTVNQDDIGLALEAGAREGHGHIVGALLRSPQGWSEFHERWSHGHTGLLQDACVSRSVSCLRAMHLVMDEIVAKFECGELPERPLKVFSRWRWDVVLRACQWGSSSEVVEYLVEMGKIPPEAFPREEAAIFGHSHLLLAFARLGASEPLDTSQFYDSMMEQDDVELLATIRDGLDHELARPYALLCEAVHHGATRITTWVLDNSPNQDWASKGENLIHMALRQGFVDILRLLLDRLGDHIAPQGKRRVLGEAAIRGHVDAMIVLLERKVKFETKQKMVLGEELLRQHGREDRLPLLAVGSRRTKRLRGKTATLSRSTEASKLTRAAS